MNEFKDWMHVVPINDLVDHSDDKITTLENLCICNPEIDFKRGLLIHHALDGRE